ncbi:ECF transporter S component [Dethiothermospora halolimnae]|uniref:ECF transporter S component n=1 Tax=Dethiothermospora halolimnae TaxID=3114390 RepID=UPI003CCBD314
MENTNIRSFSKMTTRDLVLNSLLIAIVFVATFMIKFHLPVSINDGGLVHMGTAALVAISIVFGKHRGAIAGGLGMFLFDVTSPFYMWAPFTLVIRFVMGYTIGTIAYANGKKGENMFYNIIAILISGVWMVAGYFCTNLILHHSWVGAVSSIYGDVLQVGIGLFIGLPLAMILKQVFKKSNFKF